jgi:hypothetical protein
MQLKFLLFITSLFFSAVQCWRIEKGMPQIVKKSAFVVEHLQLRDVKNEIFQGTLMYPRKTRYAENEMVIYIPADREVKEISLETVAIAKEFNRFFKTRSRRSLRGATTTTTIIDFSANWGISSWFNWITRTP